jgi:hypothetical protein
MLGKRDAFCGGEGIFEKSRGLSVIPCTADFMRAKTPIPHVFLMWFFSQRHQQHQSST